MLIEEVSPSNYRARSRALQNHLFSLLQNCNSTKQLTQIHARIITNGFTQKHFLIAKLLSSYISSGLLQTAYQIFNRLQNPTTTEWNQIIKTHSTSQMPLKSVDVYNQMESQQRKPDGCTFTFVIGACVKARALGEGIQLHGRVMSTGFCSNLAVQTNLVNFYSMVDAFDNARKAFDEMQDRSVVTWNSLLAGYIRCHDVDEAWKMFYAMPERDVVSWTTMIAGCAQNGRCKQALDLFNDMRKARMEFDQVTLVAALSACAQLGDVKLGRWIHSYIHRKLHFANIPIVVKLYNALIHMYASCGFIDEAFAVFKEMPRRTTVCWTTMITGFAKHGHGEEALELFRWMQKFGDDDVRPDEITLIGLLSACSHAGFVEVGLYFFKSMKSWGIKPRIEHYGCMVDLLSRAGRLDEALEIVETMPMKPNEAVWGALLGGCRLHKNAELASYVADKLVVELGPDQAAGYLVLLSNVYATDKRWQDFANLKRKMDEMGMRKTPGRSCVQINGIVHEFVVGDITHRDADLIYRMLFDVTREAEWGGSDSDDISDALMSIEE